MCKRIYGPKPTHHYVSTGIFIIGFLIVGIFLVVHGGHELKQIGDVENSEFETTCFHSSAPAVLRNGSPELCCVEKPHMEGCLIEGGFYDEKVTAESPCGDKELSLNTEAEDRVCRKSPPTTGDEFRCWAKCNDSTYGYNDTAGDDAQASLLLIMGIILLLCTCFGIYYFWVSDWVLMLFEDDEPSKEPLAKDSLAMDRQEYDAEDVRQKDRGSKNSRSKRHPNRSDRR